MTYKDIIYESDSGSAKITINRPKVLNAFTPQTLEEIQQALQQASKDAEVGVIVITGSGERAFCAGGDVNWEAGDDFKNHEYRLHHYLLECPKPIIARVNGYAIGGGNHLAYYCDLTIASTNAIFGQNGPRVGSPAAGATVAHLANIIGHKRAKEMWLTCKRYKAQQMLEWGLVNAVVPYAELDAEVKRWAADIMALSPTCLKIVKETFRRHIGEVLQLRQDDMVKEIAPNYFASGEQQEGAQAFLDKRSPDFHKFRKNV